MATAHCILTVCEMRKAATAGDTQSYMVNVLMCSPETPSPNDAGWALPRDPRRQGEQDTLTHLSPGDHRVPTPCNSRPGGAGGKEGGDLEPALSSSPTYVLSHGGRNRQDRADSKVGTLYVQDDRTPRPPPGSDVISSETQNSKQSYLESQTCYAGALALCSNISQYLLPQNAFKI